MRNIAPQPLINSANDANIVPLMPYSTLKTHIFTSTMKNEQELKHALLMGVNMNYLEVLAKFLVH